MIKIQNTKQYFNLIPSVGQKKKIILSDLFEFHKNQHWKQYLNSKKLFAPGEKKKKEKDNGTLRDKEVAGFLSSSSH